METLVIIVATIFVVAYVLRARTKPAKQSKAAAERAPSWQRWQKPSAAS